MGAHNFNFVPKFLNMGVFHPQILHLWTKKFPTRRKLSDNLPTAQNRAQLPLYPSPATTPVMMIIIIIIIRGGSRGCPEYPDTRPFD